MGDKKKAGLFENMIQNLSMNFVELPELLETAAEENKRVRCRFVCRYWGKRFCRRMGCAARVNAELLEHDCEALYARSFYEASLIYAFDHHMAYGEWKRFFEECKIIVIWRLLQSRISSGRENHTAAAETVRLRRSLRVTCRPRC